MTEDTNFDSIQASHLSKMPKFLARDKLALSPPTLQIYFSFQPTKMYPYLSMKYHQYSCSFFYQLKTEAASTISRALLAPPPSLRRRQHKLRRPHLSQAIVVSYWMWLLSVYLLFQTMTMMDVRDLLGVTEGLVTPILSPELCPGASSLYHR